MKMRNTMLTALFALLVFSASAQDDVSKQVVSAYLEMKDALVKTDAAITKKSADKLLESLEGQDGELYAGIITEAKKIAGTTDVKVQRAAFRPLSDNVYRLVKAKGTGITLYKQYCPMALGNTGGAWLSAEEQVLNPYFGDMMLKCGSVKETIN